MTVRRLVAATVVSLVTSGAVALGAAPASADTGWDIPKGTGNSLADTGWDIPK